MTTHFNDVVVENNLQTQNLTTNDIITTTLLVNNKDVSTTINNLNNIYQDAGDPTGFPVRTTSTISFDDNTRTFTIAPVGSTFEYYIKGTKISISSRSIVIPNVTGPYFIYLDDAGVLAYVTAFDISLLKGYAYVANVYWSATQSKSLGLAEERHGISMDWATHANLHLYTGARIQQNTFAIGNFNISGIGDNDNEVQASFGNGVITDEDINLTIINSATPTNPFEQVLSTVAELPIMYKTSTGEWVMDDPSNVLVKQGSSRIQYNQFSTGTWSTVDASDTYFVAMWVFVTNYQESPIRLFLGQRQDATLLDARTNNTYEEFNNSGLAIQEFKVIYRLIFQTDNSFTNSVKAKLVEILDVRKVIEQCQLVSSVNNHGQLSGLDQDHHQQYLNVTRADARFYTQSQIDGFLLNKITNSGNMISYSAGLNVSKPVAGSLGRNYYATDQGITYYDNGTTWNAKLPAYIGDVTSALGGTELTLATVNSNVGTFNNVTVNGKGLVTAASNVAYLTGNQTITLSGDLTGSGTTSISGTLANVNANVGTFNNITINAKGLATAGSNVAYLTGNQTITLSGDLTGSGTTGISGTLATVNSNVGTFGSTTVVPVITVNAKGLTTSVSTATLTNASVGLGNVANSLQVINSGGTVSYTTGLNASKPAAGTAGRFYNAIDQGINYYDNGTTWGAQLPAYTGDVTSLLGGTALTLATVNSNIGTFNNVTVNAKGLVTAASNVAYLTGNQTITVTGDITGSGTTAIGLTLATVNSNVGTFGSTTVVPVITVNAKGLTTAISTVALTNASVGLGNVSNNLQVINAGNGTSFSSGTLAARPSSATNGRLYATTNDGIYLDNGTTWVLQSPAYTGDVSKASNATALTLATVNSNIGTFNNITINAKGLATAGSNVNYLIDPAANGIVVRTALNTTVGRTLTGTANQINITNGSGVAGNPIFTIADNPVIPGTASTTITAGTTAQRDTPTTGKIRFNVELNQFEGARNSIYAPLGKIVQSVSGKIAVQTGTAQKFYDNLAPAPAAGFEILNVTITPYFADSTIIISFPLMVDHSVNNRTIVTSVFVNGTILVGTTATNAGSAGRPASQYLQGDILSQGAGVPLVFSVKTGANGGGTTYINRGSTATMGNTGASTYTLIEQVAG